MAGSLRPWLGFLGLLLLCRADSTAGRRHSKSANGPCHKRTGHLAAKSDCLDCAAGTYRDPGGSPARCLRCRNCTGVFTGRVLRVPCGQHSNAQCGQCKDGYRERFPRHTGPYGSSSYVYPCQHCKHDVSNSTECQSYRQSVKQREKSIVNDTSPGDVITATSPASHAFLQRVRGSGDGDSLTVHLVSYPCLVFACVVVCALLILVGLLLALTMSRNAKLEKVTRDGVRKLGSRCSEQDLRVLTSAKPTEKCCDESGIMYSNRPFLGNGRGKGVRLD